MSVATVRSTVPAAVPTQSRHWVFLLWIGSGALLVGLTLLAMHEHARNRVVYLNMTDRYPGVRVWPAGPVPVFHGRACKNRTSADESLSLGLALHQGYLPCRECLGRRQGSLAESGWRAAGTATMFGGTAAVTAGFALLVAARFKRARCPRCGSRRAGNFCAGCGAKLTTKDFVYSNRAARMGRPTA
jgi:hypothetical protein